MRKILLITLLIVFISGVIIYNKIMPGLDKGNKDILWSENRYTKGKKANLSAI